MVVLTDAMAPVSAQQEAWFTRAPVASSGVETFTVLTEPRQQALVDVCGRWRTSVTEHLFHSHRGNITKSCFLPLTSVLLFFFFVVAINNP